MIRKANINDILKLASLDSSIFEDSLGEKFISNDLELNPSACYLVYEEEGEIVGYLMSWIFDNTTILNFAVKEEYRRRGIGQQLFDEFLKYSVGDITLEVRVGNLAAINFYKKNNFEVASIRKNYYSDGEDAYLMIKR